jgi:hypothetical protein
MRFETQSWRKLYVAESMQHRLLPVLCRGLRDYLLRYAGEDGTLLAKTDDPAHDLAKALGSHPEEIEIIVRYVETWLGDGFLTHRRGRLLITRYVEAQTARSPGAERQKRHRDRQRDVTRNATDDDRSDAHDTSQQKRRDETRNDETDPPVSPPVGDDPIASDVRRVFEAWQKIHNHPGSKLDRNRANRIKARLREKFTADQLIEAIKNAKNDRFLMGENEHGRVYDGIETLLKSTAQVERLQALKAPMAPRSAPSANPRTAAADLEVERRAQADLEVERARLQRQTALLGGS